jgi:hypothetical protein
MRFEFNQAQPTIARGHQARVVTQCRKTDTGILDSFQYREICRELQRAPIDRNMRERTLALSTRFDFIREIANSGVLQH